MAMNIGLSTGILENILISTNGVELAQCPCVLSVADVDNG